MPRWSTIVGVITCIAAFAPVSTSAPATTSPMSSSSPRLRDLDGRDLRPFAPAGRANVLLFVSHECPISNSYAPEIQRICAAHAPKGVACVLLYEDPRIDPALVRAHLAEYRYAGIRASIDTTHAIAAHAGATVTPQAVVVDASGAIRYRGRIDNFYAAFGKPRRQATSHDLRDALDAVLANAPVATPETEALGCQIASPEGP